MEVVGYDRKKVIWEVVDDHVIEEETDNDEIGLRGFDFNLFDKDEKGVGREGSSEFPYLLSLFNIWTDYWKTQLKRMNMKVDEDNEKMGIWNGKYRQVHRFQSNEFWKSIGFLVSAHTFGLGGSRMWEKEEKIIQVEII